MEITGRKTQKVAVNPSQYYVHVLDVNVNVSSVNKFLSNESKGNQKQSLADVLQNKCSLNFPNFTGKHLCQSLFLIKLQASVKNCEVLKNTFFYGTPPVAASGKSFTIELKRRVAKCTKSNLNRNVDERRMGDWFTMC